MTAPTPLQAAYTCINGCGRRVGADGLFVSKWSSWCRPCVAEMHRLFGAWLGVAG